MAFRFKRTENIGDGLRRIAGEQIDRALEEIDDWELSRPIKVHQVRKRCKKLRGLIRLVRPTLGKAYKLENRSLRDTARLLSELRDANISLQTFDSLVGPSDSGSRRFDSIGQQLQQDAGVLNGDAQSAQTQLQAARERLIATRERAGQWSVKREEFDALAGGLKTTYAKARQAMRQARDQRTMEALHLWRKHVKYHGYHCRLLESTWPAMLAARSGEAGRLGDWLGEDHDLAVLRDRLLEQPERYGDLESVDAFLNIIAQRRQQLQSRCFRLGKKLFAEDRASFVRRYERYWKAWHKR